MVYSFSAPDGKRHNLWQGNSLYFKANDDKLDFNNRNLDANGNYSGGLVVLGKYLYVIKKSSLKGALLDRQDTTGISSTLLACDQFPELRIERRDIFFDQGF